MTNNNSKVSNINYDSSEYAYLDLVSKFKVERKLVKILRIECMNISSSLNENELEELWSKYNNSEIEKSHLAKKVEGKNEIINQLNYK